MNLIIACLAWLQCMVATLGNYAFCGKRKDFHVTECAKNGSLELGGEKYWT